MKILLLGDASNYHHSLSIGLQRAGHDVTVASHGSRWMQTRRDIDISRGSGKLGGALLWLKLNTILASRLKGYDVVQIYNPVFVDLRPERVKPIFDRLRRDNGAVYLTALGTDPQYVEMCTAADNPLRYSEFAVASAPTNYVKEHPTIVSEWLNPVIADYSRYVYEHIDGVVCALYEYYLSCQRQLPAHKIAYGGIPIDTDHIPFAPAVAADKLNFVLACHKGREAEKGVDKMLEVIRALHSDCPGQMTYDFIQNVPIAEFNSRLSNGHVIVDQLYSYTPATTALTALASGKATVSGAEPEYYEFIGEKPLPSIINPDPQNLDNLYSSLKGIIAKPEIVLGSASESREFVKRNNDIDVVAKRFIDFWQSNSK